MNYEEYVQIQLGGGIEKPEKYRRGEQRAINMMASSLVSILDVGCGSGNGLAHFEWLGYKNVIGIDLNLEKVKVCWDDGFHAIHGDVNKWDFEDQKFDVIWCSHAFEHMYAPEGTLRKLLQITYQHSRFFFVLPYPDLDSAPAHCAAKIIGTTIDDAGKTVVKWFTDRGLELVYKRFDEYREPEIWLEFRKSHE